MNVAVTWPKSRSLQSYLDELKHAEAKGEWVSFRVPNRPGVTPERCYMVHDGAVRGWLKVVEVSHYGEGRVRRVESDPLSGFWPAGWYIVREPIWHPIDPIPMRGFQSFHYFEEKHYRR